jgi:hypothetical protein
MNNSSVDPQAKPRTTALYKESAIISVAMLLGNREVFAEMDGWRFDCNMAGR